jgi:hypothetical protein
VVLAAAAAAVSLAAGGQAHAQAATLSQQDVEQLRAELKAISAEAQAARAQAAEGERKIDALQRQLDAAARVPPIATIAVDNNAASKGTASSGASFEVYGFAQADYIQDFNRVNPNWDATLRPSRIPTTPGQFGSDGQSIASVRQSRFGVQAAAPFAGKDFFAKFEFDLYGVGVDEGQTTMRVRHAYGSWGPILAGQTNTVFMDIDTFPNTIDYWGPNGMVFLRNPQIRYTYKTGGNEFAIAIEKPGNDIDPGQVRTLDPAIGNNIQPDEKIPDLTAHFRHDGDWGHFQIAGILRQISYETVGTPGNNPKDSKGGWGINLSSNFKVWKKDVVHLSAVYGAGIASYMNDGGTDLGPEGQPGSLRGQPLDLFGLVAYYDHYWNDKWSTSFGYSRTQVDNASFQSTDAYRTGQYASANLLWTPVKNLMMGAEFLWGERTDKNGAQGEDSRLQFSAKYSFSSNDFR